jgi:murein DD-endopeptidase MepM/ murein hydrolase activator NlpD
MAQTNSIGGGYEESRSEDNPVPAVEIGWDINDSLMNIPAYDTYCKWDTRDIHGYDFDLSKMGETDSIALQLRHEECDYHHPFRGRITSQFGERGARHHYGIDIKLYKGDPVKVAFEGVVRISQYSSSYGNVVVVRHNNGLETLYAHLSARKCKPGDHVESGKVIGLGGNTGRSTGSHLHFEVRYKGEPIDPNTLIDWESGALLHDNYDLTAKDFEYLKEARSKKYHKIRSGDTLSGIASRYGSSVNTICRLNGMSRSSTIYAGRSIRVR